MRSRLIVIAFLTTPLMGIFGSKSFFLPRPKSADLMMEMTAVRDLINRYSDGSRQNYVHFSLMALYDELYDHKAVARYFFDSQQLVFSGSQYQGRMPQDLLADYFGMSTTARTTLCFKPHMSSFTTDLFWYTGLDALYPGLYISARIPIEHTEWDLDPNEKVTTVGGTDVAGYMGPVDVEAQDTEGSLATRVKDYLKGARYTSIGNVTPFIVGDFREPLAYGRIAGRRTLTRAANVVLTVGHNSIQNDRFSLTFFGRGVLNTGNRSKAEFLFEPMVGNGGYWEIGGGWNARLDWWSSELRDKSLSFCFDLSVTHLFTTGQKRSFDLKHNGRGSRYMLMTQFGSPSQNLFLGSAVGPASPSQYQGRILPVINESTLSIKTSIPVQADLLFSALYDRRNMSVEVGYNLFVRGEEECHGRSHFPSNLFGLKGDAQVYGFDVGDNPVKLGVTQSSATLHAGQGQTNFAAGSEFQNLNADNPIIASDSVAPLNQLTSADSAVFNIPLAVVRTSQLPVLITDTDIDIRSGLLSQLITHRLFFTVSYRWEKVDEPCTPFFGFNSYVEWAQDARCYQGVPAVWALGIKGGVSF